MTVKEFKALVNAIPEEHDECPVVTPINTDMPGVFAFEGICPGVTEMVQFGPVPEFIKEIGTDQTDGMWVFVIAPHSYHDDPHDQDNEKQKVLN